MLTGTVVINELLNTVEVSFSWEGRQRMALIVQAQEARKMVGRLVDFELHAEPYGPDLRSDLGYAIIYKDGKRL